MTTVSCLNICSNLRCAINPSDTSIELIDASGFILYPDQILYLELSSSTGKEIVLMTENPTGNTISVVRGQVGTRAKYFPEGTCVCTTVLNCNIIREIIREEIAASDIPSGDIRPLDNTWTGTNDFQNTVTIFDTIIDNTEVDGNPKLLYFHSGIYALEENYTEPTGVAYGAGIGVYRKGGANFTVGAQIVGIHQDTVASSETWGIACEAIQIAGSFGAATGIEATSMNQTSNNTHPKAGIYLTFKNRWDYDTAPVQGLGANQYNVNAEAIVIGSNPRSAYGEFCGWNKALTFQPGALDEAQGGVKAIGIDFGPITNGELSRIGSWIRLRATKGIEWNGDAAAPYLPIITYFDPLFVGSGPDTGFDGMFSLENSGSLRYGINIASGIPYWNAPAGNLIMGAAGAATGTYWVVNLNGTYYKLALLAV